MQRTLTTVDDLANVHDWNVDASTVAGQFSAHAAVALTEASTGQVEDFVPDAIAIASRWIDAVTGRDVVVAWLDLCDPNLVVTTPDAGLFTRASNGLLAKVEDTAEEIIDQIVYEYERGDE